MTPFPCTIITPDGKIFDGAIEALVAPGEEGSFGILARHTPFVALLKRGRLKMTENNREIFYANGAGVLEMDTEGRCLILCDEAVPTASS